MKNKKVIYLAMIALLIISAPLSSFADKKENKGRNNEVRVKITDDASSGSGLKNAFGHLIAPGWLKHNGEVETEDGQKLPPVS